MQVLNTLEAPISEEEWAKQQVRDLYFTTALVFS